MDALIATHSIQIFGATAIGVISRRGSTFLLLESWHKLLDFASYGATFGL